MKHTKQLLLAIFTLAALASLLRYFLNQWLVSDWTNLFINIFGVFFLVVSLEGYFLAKKIDPLLIKALQIGFFGGLTTMASPFLVIYDQFQQGRYGQMILIWTVHIFGGLLACYLGRYVVRKWWEN
ncbi:CrcB family protein [Streptococcus sp. sy010]|uniref:fluoride efflux transporter FluC n=1 Tax=Streptococcus sp. sy010 TaxID=2600148 RepID=UPI0011B59B8F|nr:CrcB family protein [Streptococcus sp. sy010]TWT16519.1 hypothetical protein FRX51_00985 [Streptococcus sp. sy010]